MTKYLVLSLFCVLSICQSISAQEIEYPTIQHQFPVNPHKVGYQRTIRYSEQASKYWGFGVQTGIWPKTYIGPLWPPLFMFPALTAERGFRNHHPNDRFTDWVVFGRVAYLLFDDGGFGQGFPENFYQGFAITLGGKRLWGWNGITRQLGKHNIPLQLFYGVGFQFSARYQYRFVYWDFNINDYVIDDTWANVFLPSPSIHLAVRLNPQPKPFVK